jgi:uncharacterized membrane protein
MNSINYKKIRNAIIVFIVAVVVLAVISGSYLLASAGILTALIFLSLARSKAKVKSDEREETIREKAARMAYIIFTPTLAISAFFLMFPSKSGISVFSKGEWLYVESLGMILAYLVLFLITVYAISYYFLNKKYGGNSSD